VRTRAETKISLSFALCHLLLDEFLKNSLNKKTQFFFFGHVEFMYFAHNRLSPHYVSTLKISQETPIFLVLTTNVDFSILSLHFFKREAAVSHHNNLGHFKHFEFRGYILKKRGPEMFQTCSQNFWEKARSSNTGKSELSR
jgi:hypothetical protein